MRRLVLQQVRKRRQWLAAAAFATRGRKFTKLASYLYEFMAGTKNADLDVKNALKWWIRGVSYYPILSKMPFDLFGYPAISAEC